MVASISRTCTSKCLGLGCDLAAHMSSGTIHRNCHSISFCRQMILACDAHNKAFDNTGQSREGLGTCT